MRLRCKVESLKNSTIKLQAASHLDSAHNDRDITSSIGQPTEAGVSSLEGPSTDPCRGHPELFKGGDAVSCKRCLGLVASVSSHGESPSDQRGPNTCMPSLHTPDVFIVGIADLALVRRQNGH
ncbi:hypothetical protein B0O80DRAFT_488954 [Mortierella sp. GBAus27b]|nr:hypothetical protein B0O80DRAFT_488954 [Mortierella sp. GBAus27b]